MARLIVLGIKYQIGRKSKENYLTFPIWQITIYAVCTYRVIICPYE
jgi:hypothetical protein